jgi:hypothetical protein
MGKVLEFQAGKSSILIESSDVGYEGCLIQASGLSLKKNFDQMLEKVTIILSIYNKKL